LECVTAEKLATALGLASSLSKKATPANIYIYMADGTPDDLFSQPRTIDLGDSAEYGCSSAVSRREGGESISSEGEPSRRERPMKT